MEEKHEKILNDNLTRICNGLEPSVIFASLIEGGVLTHDETEVISGRVTRNDRAMQLIQILLRKGPHAFPVFLDSLKGSHQHLFDHLRSQEEQIWENPSASPTAERESTTEENASATSETNNQGGSLHRKRYFGEFPTPQLLRDANVDYAIDTKREDREKNESGELIPFPTSTSNAEIVQENNYTKLDARATDQKAMLEYLDGPLEDLVNFLCKPAEKYIEKVRVLFVWLAALDLSELDDADPPEGSVREQLLELNNESATHSSFYIKMCRLANLEAKEIKGLGRGDINWEPGVDVADAAINSWVAVVINNSWRLCDPHWASRAKNKNEYMWDLIDGHGKGSSVLPSEEQSLSYRYDDHYFLTDPEAFIYTHFPFDEQWQLLARPVTRREFNELADLRSEFFKTGLRMKSHRKCTMKSLNGEVDIAIEMPNRKLSFMHQLWMWSSDRHQQNVGDLTLDRFVFRHVKGNEMQVHLEFPAPGKYRFMLFVRDCNEPGTEHTCACAYVIHSEAAKQNIQPLPENNRGEWGPGPDLINAGLEPTSHEDAVIEAEHGVVRLTFKADGDVTLGIFLHNNKLSTDYLKNFVVYHQEENSIVIDAKLPSRGEYALNLFAKEAGENELCLNVCCYLLTSAEATFDAQPFPAVPNGFAGATRAGRDSGVKCVSHKAALIEAPKSGELDIDLKIPTLFDVVGKLSYQVGNEALEMERYMMTTIDQNDQVRFSIRFPDAGFYSLKVYGAPKEDDTDNLASLYNFLINVPTPKKDCPAFPKTYPSFIYNKCRVEAPLTGTLPANQSIPFAIYVPYSHNVATKSSKDWTQLAKIEDGMWIGIVETGDPGSEVSVGARLDENADSYTFVLSYEIQKAEDILITTRAHQRKHQQAQKRIAEENAKKHKRRNDVQRTHQDLVKAIEMCSTKKLNALHWYIKFKRYVTHMKDDVSRSKDLIRSLNRIEELKAAILNMDPALFAEIRRYANPPKQVHEVMVASLLLLGDHEGKTRDWMQCQKLCTAIGPEGLLERVRGFDLRKLHPQIAAQANWLLSQYRLDDVREKSVGAATFYSWTMGMTEELKTMKS